ncbi:MAG TPA: ribosome-associated translation inhibitor RaiA [Solibacterales bacterium]|nr:ribosome-associated translation inhibitor RaiA [Bryobacterales bacterium]
MKVTYTGKIDKLLPAQQTKIEARFAKLAKFFDRKGEKEARIIVTSERHLQHAEITVQWYDHSVVCVGSDSDLSAAVHEAVDKLEKQILKLRTKWRDTKRSSAPPKGVPEEIAVFEPEAGQEKRIFRVNHQAERKPMTLEEAMLEMEDGLDYVAYRDAQSDRVSVLVRRRDGHFDLVEA